MLHRVDFYFYKFIFYRIKFRKILILEFFFYFTILRKKILNGGFNNYTSLALSY